MVQAAAVISLAERLRKRSYRVRSHDVVADLRLATRYLNELAALAIAVEAEVEVDPAQKLRLYEEAAQLHTLSTVNGRRAS